jgi:hypothetical protein
VLVELESDDDVLVEGAAVGSFDADCDEERDVERLLDGAPEREELTLDDAELPADSLDDALAEPLLDEDACVERERDALIEDEGAPEADALELCELDGARDALADALAENDGCVE